jgi:hypothetical protein
MPPTQPPQLPRKKARTRRYAKSRPSNRYSIPHQNPRPQPFQSRECPRHRILIHKNRDGDHRRILGDRNPRQPRECFKLLRAINALLSQNTLADARNFGDFSLPLPTVQSSLGNSKDCTNIFGR